MLAKLDGLQPAGTREVQSSLLSSICSLHASGAHQVHTLTPMKLKVCAQAWGSNNTEIVITVYACKKDKTRNRTRRQSLMSADNK